LKIFVHAIVFSHFCQQNPLVCQGNVKDVGMGSVPQSWFRPKVDATTAKKLNYQWSFSYPTGFTGSAGFSFLFLSFLLPAIASPGRLA
jgi:hypothetical protein